MQRVRDFLALGFEPSAELARDYLRDILPGELRCEEDAPSLLRRIIDESVYQRGHRSICLPLTAGLDSRSILGACLDVFDRKDIHCVTFGSRNTADNDVARFAAARNGVSHRRIEPNALQWDPDGLLAKARDTYSATGCRIPIDALMVFGAIESFADGRCVLSGYLGDAVSGKHLPEGVDPNDENQVIDSFIAKNRCFPPLAPSDTAIGSLLSVMRETGAAIGKVQGATRYDLLDLGFRQRHRIRGSTMGSSTLIMSPYEDRRWLAHWLHRPLADRLGQNAYFREMRAAFPSVFAERPARGLSAALRRIFGKPASSRPRIVLERGDPNINRSMRETMRELLGSFDGRGIVDLVLPSFDGSLSAPKRASANRAKWAATAEIHMRAGNFAG